MLKKLLSLFLVFLLLGSNFSFMKGTASAEGTGGGDERDWTLVWEDEFEGDQLDSSKWSYDIGNGFYDDNGTFISGWGNEELQSYQEENVRVENGQLIIQAKEETVSDENGTYNYTSGKIHTQGKFSQKYGRFEAKMALPAGQGFWPAFWMMPEDDVYGSWAASGEIDIMENAGATPHKIGGAIHYGGQWPNNTYTAKDYYFPEGKDVTDSNVYAVEWEPGEIRWYVNGELYQTLNNWSSTGIGNSEPFAYPAPFDQEFYLILNLAVGGWYGGNPDETTPFPGEMVVDYVRVYELPEDQYREPVEPAFEVEELPSNAKTAIDDNYVYDPNFEEGFTTISNHSELEHDWDPLYWNLVYLPDFNGKGIATVDTLEGKRFAKVDITQGGSQPYSVQLIQNVTLGKGRWYKLSFDAKSITDRNLNVKLGGGPERGYTAYSPNRDFSLTSQVQSYELSFQMQQDTDVASRLEFNMGLNTNSVWIGNVKVEEIAPLDRNDQADPVDPIDPSDQIDPAKKQWKEVGENLLFDGSFESTTEFGFGENLLEGWNIHNQGLYEEGAGLADFSVVDEAANAVIQQVGWEWWHIQLFQDGIEVPSGMYKIAFDMSSELERPVYVELAGAAVPIQTFTVGSEIQTYESIFEVAEDGTYKFLFGLGRAAEDAVLKDGNTIKIDNVRLVAVMEVEEEKKKENEESAKDEPESVEQGNKDKPGSETPIKKEKGEDNKKLKGTETEKSNEKEKEKEKENKLPNTATSNYTYLTIGLILLVVGTALYFVRKRKNQVEM
ncbi:family 16 glycosylhydrolase [Alkalihalobacterium sp. APHAB7]|uniref:family 16 glycosylhydrolase n=1 Tax=Alkalihalobacterium sp. APHAB7 TaxID=3402081 RepID=UPI003AADBA90